METACLYRNFSSHVRHSKLFWTHKNRRILYWIDGVETESERRHHSFRLFRGIMLEINYLGQAKTIGKIGFCCTNLPFLLLYQLANTIRVFQMNKTEHTVWFVCSYSKRIYSRPRQCENRLDSKKSVYYKDSAKILVTASLVIENTGCD